MSVTSSGEDIDGHLEGVVVVVILSPHSRINMPEKGRNVLYPVKAKSGS